MANLTGIQRLRNYPALTGLRGVGLFVVITHHADKTAIRGSWVAIDIFFAISAFLITGLLLQEIETRGRIDVRRFFVRRALRLLPAMAAFLLGCLILALVVLDGRDQRDLLFTVAVTAFYVANVWNAAALPVEYGHTWSLSLEEQFYALWPFVIAFAFRSWTRTTAIVVTIGALAATALLPVALYLFAGRLGRWDALYFSGIAHLQVIIGGALLAQLYVWRRLPAFVTRRACLEAIAVASWIILVAVAIAFPTASAFPYLGGLTLVGLASVGIVFAGTAERPLWSTWLVRWPPIVAVGVVSYSAYLWHETVLREVAVAVPGPLALSGVVASLAAGGLSYVIVERPFLRRKAKLAIAGAAPADRWSGEVSFRPT